MGQGQSTSQQGGATNEASEGKTDYYELLGVEKTASDEEIKKAYRKKALQLHPDRNHGNVETSTKLFAEVQVAYEVLSDPQERAWYDSHRDAILRGENASESDSQYYYDTRMTTADDVLALFSKFSPRMDFSDSPSGFYGGLREIFERIAREEEMACRWENFDPVDYPSFGNRDDDFDTVVRPFYAAWAGFATKKTFAWKDVYRYSEAPDRRVRRLMEKENRRLRDEGIREFNDAVRSLVAFAKKRDPRYKANAVNEAQRQQMLRDSAAAQAARSRAANEAKIKDHIVPDWALAEEQEPEEDESDQSLTEEEQYECVVCRKSFKSEKQFQAHERSKKHIKAVKQLRWEMRNEDKELELGPDPSIDSSTKDIPPESPVDEIEPKPKDQMEDSVNGSDDECDDRDTDVAGDQAQPLTDPELHDDTHEDTSGVDDDYAPRQAVETRLRSELLSGQDVEADALSHKFAETELEDHTKSQPPKIGKAKQKRAKKAAIQKDEQSRLTCAKCNASFSSRTQLFNHIEELGHAQPVQGSKTAKKGRKR
ncbi:j domain containing protein [Paecilomyces variotii No. 5]|uniref:J domain containing protein n=1 Tax=Byssochlamys spectabilis (strain No. 5 / NBRC 109023) TaxID=1356009 RepID=V5FP72_BYSSN|nr:j domain containing protein [Paecilomyces variotii No. 5]